MAEGAEDTIPPHLVARHLSEDTADSIGGQHEGALDGSEPGHESEAAAGTALPVVSVDETTVNKNLFILD